MTSLALLRHGQSRWNLENRFTGWVDVDLTPQGEAEARRSGELLAASGVPFDKLYTSVQTRAIRTGGIALDAAKLSWLPVERDWRLNERHYGALTGLDKAETAAKHGDEQVKVWRRSYDVPPPGGESRIDVANRSLPVVHELLETHPDIDHLVGVFDHGAVSLFVDGVLSGSASGWSTVRKATGGPVGCEREASGSYGADSRTRPSCATPPTLTCGPGRNC